MIEFNQYADLKGITTRTLYRWIGESKVLPHNTSKGIFIIDPAMGLSKDSRAVIMKEKKKEFEAAILKAHNNRVINSTIVETTTRDILKQVEDLKKNFGIKMNGFSATSIWRKINKPSKLKRKKRNDFGKIKIEVLQDMEVQDKILGIAYQYYENDGTGSVSLLADNILRYSAKNEDFYEIASLKKSTLYDHLRKKIDQYGLKILHRMKNNYHKYIAGRIYNEGAFTRDIQFMDFLAIDDHVQEVAGAYVFNQVSGKYELKKIYLWSIIECKTWRVVAYRIKTDPFNTEDIKMLVLEALMSIGRPVKGILMDNGLAATKPCQEMLDRLGIPHDPGPAYEPLHKAVIERSFGFVKNEFNAKWKNYIGGKRSEVRHSSKKLSPEQCDYTIEKYIHEFDRYINGFYETRERTRTDNQEKVKICIRDDFDSRYSSYEKQELDRSQIRQAYMRRIKKTLKWFCIEMGRDLGTYACEEPLFLSLDEREYWVCYNPLDMNYIDILIAQDFIVPETGEELNEGDHVATLKAVKYLGNEERQALVSKIRKQYNKSARKAIKGIEEMFIVENIDVFDTEVSDQGHLIDARKELRKEVRDLVNTGFSDISRSISKFTPSKATKDIILPEFSDEDFYGTEDYMKGLE